MAFLHAGPGPQQLQSHFRSNFNNGTDVNVYNKTESLGLILGLRPANERRHYKVTSSLIGWAQT